MKISWKIIGYVTTAIGAIASVVGSIAEGHTTADRIKNEAAKAVAEALKNQN